MAVKKRFHGGGGICMEPEIFLIELKSDISDSAFDTLFLCADRNKQQQINRMKIKTDKDMSLTGYWLAKLAIKKVFGISIADIDFAVEESGKPYIIGYPDVHFNISHSGHIVVCAVCDKPVGVDIQLMKSRSFDRLAKRAFTDKEQKLFFSLPPDKRREQFFSTWTAKESYIKYLGTGVRDLKKDIENCRVSTYSYSNDYIISVCAGR